MAGNPIVQVQYSQILEGLSGAGVSFKDCWIDRKCHRFESVNEKIVMQWIAVNPNQPKWNQKYMDPTQPNPIHPIHGLTQPIDISGYNRFSPVGVILLKCSRKFNIDLYFVTMESQTTTWKQNKTKWFIFWIKIRRAWSSTANQVPQSKPRSWSVF